MSEDPLIKNQVLATVSNTVILEQSSARWKGRSVVVALTAAIIEIIDAKSTNSLLAIYLSDVIGAHVTAKEDNKYQLHIFYYPKSQGGCCGPQKNVRVRHSEVIEFPTTLDVCNDWKNAIMTLAYGDVTLQRHNERVVYQRTKKYLVFVNPVSGPGKAQKIWNNEVKVMFDEADIVYDLVITQRANHAHDHMTTINFRDYHAVVIIGGDGLMAEVVNGIYQRNDSAELFESVPLCPIPGGSGNGLVKSILFESNEEYSVINAAYVAVKGVAHRMDLCNVYTPAKSYRAFLMFGWGLISDIDIMSESLRCLGELRFYLAAVYFIMKRKLYRGRLSLLVGNNAIENNNQKQASVLNYDRNSLLSMDATLPPLNEPIPDDQGWLKIEGNFIFVWVLQTSHASATMYSGPTASLDDGVFTIFVAQELSRTEMIELLLAFDAGEHLTHPKLKCYKARAYRLEPLTEKGIYSLDGEVVDYGPIQGITNPSAAKILKLPPMNPLENTDIETGRV